MIRVIQADELRICQEKFAYFFGHILYKISYLLKSDIYLIASSIKHLIPSNVAKNSNSLYFTPVPFFKENDSYSSTLSPVPTTGILFRGVNSKGFSLFVEQANHIKRITNSSVKIYVFPDSEDYNFPSWCTVIKGKNRADFYKFLFSIDVFINTSQHDAVSFINFEVLDTGRILLCRDLISYSYLPKERVFKFNNEISLLSELEYIYKNIDVINSENGEWMNIRKKLLIDYGEVIGKALRSLVGKFQHPP